MPATKKGQTLRKETKYGHSYLLDGVKCDGVTTIIGRGLPKPALFNWGKKATAEAAVRERHIWEDMPEPSAIQWLKTAPDRDRDQAARRGTEVHNLAERLRDGGDIDVPAEIAGHVDAYVRFLEDWQPDPLLIEAVVGNRTHRYMGTFDSLERIGDDVWLLDIKTNRSGPFGEVAFQLAAYRYAEFVLDADGDEQPMPEVDRCGVVWVTDTGYELYEYRADDVVFRQFLYIKAVGDALAASKGYRSEPLGMGVAS